MENSFYKFKSLSEKQQKKQILDEIQKCIKKYNDNLLNKTIIIIYKNNSKVLEKSIDFFEVKFSKENFYHLTGITYLNDSKKINNISKMFYNNMLKSNISSNQISFKRNTNKTVYLKLLVLNNLLDIKTGAKMIGEYDGTAKKQLYCEKVVGGVSCCMGFVKEKSSDYYRPNTALKENILDITNNTKSIIAIFEKEKYKKTYKKLTYLNSNYNINILFRNNKIANLLDPFNIETERKDSFILKKINTWNKELEELQEMGQNNNTEDDDEEEM